MAFSTLITKQEIRKLSILFEGIIPTGLVGYELQSYTYQRHPKITQVTVILAEHGLAVDALISVDM